MDLLALVDFNLVARHGGFGRAARASGRPKATLSRRVAELESSLGLRLFERGARMLKLTQEGQALHARTGALLNEIDEATSAIASGGEQVRGRLKISAPALFSQAAMGKLAAGFVRKYPDVRLEVTSEDRSVDMVEEGYDLAIRVNPHPDASLIGRVFLRDRLVVVASPDLSARQGDAAVPAVVYGAGAATPVWKVKGKKGSVSIAVQPVLRLSSLFMVRDAVRLGVGVGRLPLSLISHDLASGKLVAWGELDVPDTELWALYPSRRLLSARVAAFLSYLKEAFPTGMPEELARYIANDDVPAQRL